MKISTVALCLGEQAFASGFTFLIFCTATRLLDQPSLEVYTALFSLNQSFSFFLFGMVLQPIASSAGRDAKKQLGVAVVLLGVLLAAFAAATPLAMRCVESLHRRVTVNLCALSSLFFASQCIYEAARWLTIRLRGARASVVGNAVRFILFFSVVLGIGKGHLDARCFVLVQVAVNALAVAVFAHALRGAFHEVTLIVPDRSATHHIANLGTSIANFGTNFVTFALVDRGLGGAGLAAFQALRSATNPIGLLSQVVDNHFSADLARSGRRLALRSRLMRLALITSGLLVLTTIVLGPGIVRVLFGDRFVGHWILLPLLLLASLTHAVTRPIFVNWRLAGDLGALNTYSAVLLVGVLPVLALLGLTGRTLSMIVVFALLPGTAAVVLLLRRPAGSVA